jgi:signal transduction histidine kinase
LRVVDEGPGIPAPQRSRLFERFSRFGEGRPDSSGLGLFIVKTLVDAQGGSVSVDFPAAGGSVFEVWFPSERDRLRPGGS